MELTINRFSRRTFLLAAARLYVGLKMLGYSSRLWAADKTMDTFQYLAPGSTLLHGNLHQKIMQQVQLRFHPDDLQVMEQMFKERKGHFANAELWGKAVRAMVKAYNYQPSPQLKAGLEATVNAILASQTADGCISSFPYDKQPYNADLWCRKYVLLGLEDYYSVVNRDPRVLQALIRMADYTLDQIGPAPKVRIIDTGWAFEGIESSSILEAMVRLYELTGFARYLTFAKYIVEEEGACKRENIFDAVLKKPVRDVGSNGNPHQSIAKQYEMISCFEGLVEYYRVTGNEVWKRANVAFYQSVLATETTIVGVGGGLGSYNLGPAPSEQWNDSTRAQIHPTRLGIEGCAAPRWIGFCDKMLRLTGDPDYADKIECVLLNALLGSIRRDGAKIDYHTNLNGVRNNAVNFAVPINGKQITCCVYNVVDALALIPMVEVMTSATGPVINLYFDGESSVELVNGELVHLRIASDFPRGGSVRITVTPKKPVAFNLKLRIPDWSAATTLKVNGESKSVTPKSYASLERTWCPGDLIQLDLEMKCHIIHPPEGSQNPGDDYFAMKRGPVVLVRDRRLDPNLNEPVALSHEPLETIDLQPVPQTVPAQMEFIVPVASGSCFHVIDFASAGATWDHASEYRTWIVRSSMPGDAGSIPKNKSL